MNTAISELVSAFMTEERPVCNLLDVSIITAHCIAATKFYAGYSDLETWLSLPVTDPITPYPDITDTTALSISEFAIIRPLFMFYVERENALYLESSRGLGVEPFGRSSSEVSGDIAAYEQNMHHIAFNQDIVTV